MKLLHRQLDTVFPDGKVVLRETGHEAAVLVLDGSGDDDKVDTSAKHLSQRVGAKDEPTPREKNDQQSDGPPWSNHGSSLYRESGFLAGLKTRATGGVVGRAFRPANPPGPGCPPVAHRANIEVGSLEPATSTGRGPVGIRMITNDRVVDAVLVGGGVMSATVGALLKELEPGWSIEVFERLHDVALESSHVYNNAGTGHSAYCELNYTPERSDGTVDVSKALKINELFEVSRQFWAYLVSQGQFIAPREFINPVPHISFVRGDSDVRFLQRRFDGLVSHPLFEGMEYSEDRAELADWMPLIMSGRDPNEKVAATRARAGTDVNFGALTHGLFRVMNRSGQVRVHLQHEVKNLTRLSDGTWRLTVKDLARGKIDRVTARFVFLGAGGRGASAAAQLRHRPVQGLRAAFRSAGCGSSA